MKSTRRTVAVVAAWTAVAVIGVGSVGVALADSGSASPSASASTSASASGGSGSATGPAQKKLHGLRARTLHGELAVQTKDGVTTFEVQKGSVTAVSPTSLTVKSTDGFTVTWTLNDQTKVRKDRQASTAAALANGVEVRVVGPKDGSTTTARVVAIAG